MRKMSRILLVAVLLLVVYATQAQTVSPVDFMRLNPYQLRSNPAANLPYNSVLSVAIGNVGLDVRNTSLRYDNLFEFDAEGRPASVSLTKFANSLKEDNFTGFNANWELFTFYRRLVEGAISINYGVKVQGDARYNDGLFKLLGYGNGAFVGEDNPAFVDLKLNAMAYQELAVGYQYNLTEQLSVGGRAKLLFGLFDVKTEAFNATIYTDPESYALRIQESVAMRLAMPNVVYADGSGRLKTDGRFGLGELFRNPGLALDFGAEYRINPQFSLVAAVHDLGFIHWGKNSIDVKGQINDAGQFYDNGDFLFEGLNVDELQLIISDDWYRGEFLDTLQRYFQLQYDPLSSYTTSLNTNLLIRGNFDLDAHNRFSAQAQGCFLGTGFRPAFTVAYCGSFWDNLNVCVSYTAMPESYDNIGLGLSAMIKTCNIYLTTNNLLGVFKPLNTSAYNVQLGIVFNMFVPGKRFVDESNKPSYLE